MRTIRLKTSDSSYYNFKNSVFVVMANNQETLNPLDDKTKKLFQRLCEEHKERD